MLFRSREHRPIERQLASGHRVERNQRPLEGDALPVEIICPYEDDDGDEAERVYDIRSVEKRMDPDTAGEYIGITCADA